jgi:hypothetical protein
MVDPSVARSSPAVRNHRGRPKQLVEPRDPRVENRVLLPDVCDLLGRVRAHEAPSPRESALAGCARGCREDDPAPARIRCTRQRRSPRRRREMGASPSAAARRWRARTPRAYPRLAELASWGPHWPSGVDAAMGNADHQRGARSYSSARGAGSSSTRARQRCGDAGRLPAHHLIQRLVTGASAGRSRFTSARDRPPVALLARERNAAPRRRHRWCASCDASPVLRRPPCGGGEHSLGRAGRATRRRRR